MGKKNDVDNKFVMYQNTEEMVAHLTREKIYTQSFLLCVCILRYFMRNY